MTGVELLALAAKGMTVIEILKFVGDQIPNSDVISAHFDAEGQRLSGSEKIELEISEFDEKGNMADDITGGIWLFGVKELPGYSFQRFPLIDSGIIEQLGFDEENPTNPSARIWRWIAAPKPNTTIDGGYLSPNVLVEFVVVGYKSDALLKHFSS